MRTNKLLPLVLLVLAGVSSWAAPGSRARSQARPIVVGYFPQWGLSDEDPPYYVSTLQRNGGAALLDQLNYAQGFVTGGHCSVADPNADMSFSFTAANSVSGRADTPRERLRGNFHQLQELKRRHPRLKILISLEGKADSFAEDARPENRRAFVRSCVDLFLRGRLAPGITAPHLFDGIDVDWEYPSGADADNFVALLREFRRQMALVRPGLRLTIAVGHSPHMYHGLDMREVARLVDQVGVMNYDYVGPWSQTTGLVAPLFLPERGSIDRGMTDYVAAGVPARKLLLGLPFYGYGWTGVVRGDQNGLFQPGKGIHGDRPYSYIAALPKGRAPGAGRFAAYRERHSQAPWLYDGQTFWTYEDPVSVRYKMQYARHNRLGGVMIWELSGDTPDAELLRTVRTALDHPVRHWEIPAEEKAAAPLPTATGGRLK